MKRNPVCKTSQFCTSNLFFSFSIQFTTLIFSYNITTKYLLPMSSGKIYMKTEFSFFSTGSSIRYQRQTVICWQVRTIHSTNIEISRGTLNEKHLNFHGEIYNLITLFFSSNINSINFTHWQIIYILKNNEILSI